jgi:hypothetical protein
MKTCLLLLLTLFGTLSVTFAETCCSDTITGNCAKRVSINLYHQHHDFFGKAFSYQGLETAVFLTSAVYAGPYASVFASNLKSAINNQPHFIWIAQSGLHSGVLLFQKQRIHPGIQLDAGLFFLRADRNNFTFSEIKRTASKLNGMVFSPQVFGELNVVKRFKIRLGFSYNYYRAFVSNEIDTKQLNHVSFSFGLVGLLGK